MGGLRERGGARLLLRRNVRRRPEGGGADDHDHKRGRDAEHRPACQRGRGRRDHLQRSDARLHLRPCQLDAVHGDDRDRCGAARRDRCRGQPDQAGIPGSSPRPKPTRATAPTSTTADLVSAQVQLNWACYNDTPMNDQVTISGYVTSAQQQHPRVHAGLPQTRWGPASVTPARARTGFRHAADRRSGPGTASPSNDAFVTIDGLEIDGSPCRRRPTARAAWPIGTGATAACRSLRLPQHHLRDPQLSPGSLRERDLGLRVGQRAAPGEQPHPDAGGARHGPGGRDGLTTTATPSTTTRATALGTTPERSSRRTTCR